MNATMVKPKLKPVADHKSKRPALEEGRVRAFSMEMDAPLYELLDRFAKEDRRDKRTVVTMALEKFFSDKGLWPPTDTK